MSQDIEYFIRNDGEKYTGFWDNESKEFYTIEIDCHMAYFTKEEFPEIEWLDESIHESAIQLIKDIRHGNIYNSPAGEAQKWLINNGIEQV